MIDRFASRADSSTGSASVGFIITPNDATELSEVTRAIYVGIGGDMTIELTAGGTVELQNVPTGSLIPVRAKKVLTATTATSLVGLS